jgi:hypothetical protein
LTALTQCVKIRIDALRYEHYIDPDKEVKPHGGKKEDPEEER